MKLHRRVAEELGHSWEGGGVRVRKPVFMQGVIHVYGRLVHVLGFCKLSYWQGYVLFSIVVSGGPPI